MDLKHHQLNKAKYLIEKYLLTADIDPFTRDKLTLEQLIEYNTLENIREKIGKIVKLNELENISLTINNTLNEIDLWTKKIIKIRNETIFNIGNSGTIAGEIIRKKLSE